VYVARSQSLLLPQNNAEEGLAFTALYSTARGACVERMVWQAAAEATMHRALSTCALMFGIRSAAAPSHFSPRWPGQCAEVIPPSRWLSASSSAKRFGQLNRGRSPLPIFQLRHQQPMRSGCHIR